MPFVIMTLRAEPHYRREAFEEGFRRLGYTIKTTNQPTRAVASIDDRIEPASRDDVLCVWNRKIGHDEQRCDLFEARGGTVVVCENAYLQKVDKSAYAISAHAHNGDGFSPYDDWEDRFSPLGFVQKPWRETGKHVLVCGQRGVGSKRMASPPGWHQRLKTTTELALSERGTPVREVRVRAHPGNFAARVPLEQDLKDAWACVVWSSACGVRALVEGIPVFVDAPAWICRDVAYRPKSLTKDFTAPRATFDQVRIALNRMAHGQWSVDEIRSGEPIARLRDAGWGERPARIPGVTSWLDGDRFPRLA